MRESHRPELRRALEEGVWADGEPVLAHARNGLALLPPDRVRIRAWAEVAAQYTVTDPRIVDALSPFYVWTSDYAEKRLEWKRRHPLHVLLLRTYRIPRPVTVRSRRSTRAAARGLSSRAISPSRAPRCSPTRSSSAPPRRSSRSRSARASRSSPSRHARRRGAVPWTESSSPHFEARHEDTDQRGAAAVLELLETTRESLARIFPQVPEEVTVVMHATPFALSSPRRPCRWLAREPRAGPPLPRGLVRGRTLHLLAPAALERRASAVPDSRDMLMMTPAALYAQLVIAANNRSLPPPLRPQHVRWAWLIWGAPRTSPARTCSPGRRSRAACATIRRRASRPCCATPRCSAARSSTCSNASAAPNAAVSLAFADPRAHRRACSSRPSPGAR